MTSLRDSISMGIDMILHLGEVLVKLETASNWNFIHIVLTDG